jgi:hypothetical protein
VLVLSWGCVQVIKNPEIKRPRRPKKLTTKHEMVYRRFAASVDPVMPFIEEIKAGFA